MSTDSNDMAFPVLDRSQTPNDTTQLGLSKREYFAALAMQALLTDENNSTGYACETAVKAADLLIQHLNMVRP